MHHVHGPSPPQKINLVIEVIDHERGAWSGFHDFMTPQGKSIIHFVVPPHFWSGFELNFRSILGENDYNLI